MLFISYITTKIVCVTVLTQNMGLRQELERLKKENLLLRDKLSKFTDV